MRTTRIFLRIGSLKRKGWSNSCQDKTKIVHQFRGHTTRESNEMHAELKANFMNSNFTFTNTKDDPSISFAHFYELNIFAFKMKIREELPE